MKTISFSDKSVRDFTQRATLKKDTITIKSYYGRKILFQYSFKIAAYLKRDPNNFNIHSQRIKFIEKQLTKNNKGVDKTNPLHVRIVQAQKNAVDKIITVDKIINELKQKNEQNKKLRTQNKMAKGIETIIKTRKDGIKQRYHIKKY